MPIHPSAVIDPSARVHESADVGPGVVIGREVEIGEGCVLMHGAHVHDRVVMGRENVLHPYAVLGGDPQFLGFDSKLRTGVRIGDKNVFREHSTVHRSLYEGKETVLGNNNYLMTSSHIGHDCILGNHITIVNFTGIAGHCEIEDRVFISGLVGVHQFCRIGTLAMVGGHAGVTKDVPPYTTVKSEFAFVVGVNVVGMRRAGVGTQGRAAVQQAVKLMFRSRMSLPNAIAKVREQWAGQEMPAELAHLLAFCEAKSRRGMTAGPRIGRGRSTEAGDDA